MYITAKQVNRMFVIAKGKKRKLPKWTQEQVYDYLRSVGIKNPSFTPIFKYAGICRVLEGLPKWSLNLRNKEIV